MNLPSYPKVSQSDPHRFPTTRFRKISLLNYSAADYEIVRTVIGTVLRYEFNLLAPELFFQF